MTGSASEGELNRARDLIRGSFAEAQATGKERWFSMTSAVLKNRMLQLSARSFDEKRLGFDSFRDFLGAMGDLVEIDNSARPAIVTLRRDERVEERDLRTHNLSSARIRSDLWDAIIGYSAGHEWAWDAAESRAVDASGADSLPALPTMTKKDMERLRESFIDTLDPEAIKTNAGSIQRWVAAGLGTVALPPTMRGRWNEFVKVEVIRRLVEFFDEHDLERPADLTEQVRRSPLLADDRELLRLRSMVIDCVRSMTLEEVSALNLPAASVLRCQGRGKGSRE